MQTKPPNLCFVGSMLGKNPGYITTQGQILADLFAADGYKVTCVSAKLNRAARLTEISTTLLKKRNEIDIVIAEVYGGASFVITDAVGKLCRILGIPLIMVLHGGNLPEFILKHPTWTRRVLNYADYLIAPSPFIANKLAEHGYEIRVIPNVIDLNSYTFRERRKISPHLFWMRSFHPIYNPQMAVKVLAELKKTIPEASLTMGGVNKGIESEVKNLAENLGLADAVKFVGFLNPAQKDREFSAADIYLNTNRVDNLPVSVIESCACGLPVVATDVGGLSFLLNNGENGLLVESENIKAMTEAVKTLLENPDLTNKISLNARKSAQKYAWTSVKKEWEALFIKAVQQEHKTLKQKTVRR